MPDFYDEYPRTYRLWLVVNPVELAIALGLPSAVWCVVGAFAPASAMPLAVLGQRCLSSCCSTLTGRNMGEVARLWMLFMPPLLVGGGLRLSTAGPRAGRGRRLGGASWSQTLALQSMIQVVYPV